MLFTPCIWSVYVEEDGKYTLTAVVAGAVPPFKELALNENLVVCAVFELKAEKYQL